MPCMAYIITSLLRIEYKGRACGFHVESVSLSVMVWTELFIDLPASSVGYPDLMRADWCA